jgi:hypothetical protein
VAFFLAVAVISGFVGVGCKQDPDKITVYTNSNDNIFRDLNISTTADCLLVTGVDIPLRAIASYGNSSYGNYAEQNWTNRVVWSVPDSSFGTITPAGVLRAKRTGMGEVMATSPEGWLAQRSLTIQSINAITMTADVPVMFRNDTTRIELSVLLSNGYSQTVPSRIPVSWHFSDPSVVHAIDTRTLSGVHAGVTTVSASLSGMSTEPVVLVVDSVLSVSCSEISTGPYFPMDTLRFSASAVTSVSGRLDVGNRVNWLTSDPGRMAYISDGVFVAVAPGAYNVWVDLNGQSSSGWSTQVWNVVSLSITPSSISDTLRRGDTLRFTAMGVIEGHTAPQDLTTYAEWISTEGIAGTFIAPGVFVAGGAGSTSVWAKIGAVTTQQVPLLVTRTPLFSETFESYGYGSFSGGTLWNVSYYSPSRVAINSLSSGGTHSCMFVDSSYSGYSYIESRSGAFNPVTRGILEADIRTEGNGAYLELASSSGNVVAYVVFQDNSIYAYTYSGSQQLQSYVTNRWYHVRIDFDCDSDLYDVYVDGVLRGSQLHFYYTTNSVYTVTAGTSGSYQGNRTYIDNLVLTE